MLDWRKKQQTQAAVRKTVRDMFNAALPPSYTKEICDETYAAVYQHIYDSYYGMDRSISATHMATARALAVAMWVVE